MILVIDTNIVFSTLLNPHSLTGEILMNTQDQITLFAPDLLKEELERHAAKILNYTKLTSSDVATLKELIFSNITFVSEELISERSWVKAFALTESIDENDTPFVALAIELNAKLWSGDKTLSEGLFKRNSDLTISTSDLKQLLK